ncbi:hypothetical protein D3C75_1035610 [compost metagenome]
MHRQKDIQLGYDGLEISSINYGQDEPAYSADLAKPLQLLHLLCLESKSIFAAD